MRVTLIRHGRASAGWGDDLDPGLDETGRAQATAVADALGGHQPGPIVTSPLRRARETAAPLAARWARTATVEPAVGEIRSPTLDLDERTRWLTEVMTSTWSSLDADRHAWRRSVLDALLALSVDTVVFTHLIAINAAVGAATDDPRVVCFAPDNCSQTVLEVLDGRLRLLRLGAQAATVVQ